MYTRKNLLLMTGMVFSLNAFAENNSAMLPVDTKAPVTANKMITIDATPEKVWETLIQINSWSDWQKDIESSSVNENLYKGTKFVWKSGGLKITSNIHTVNHQQELGWTGKAIGTRAIHNWTLEEKDGQTIVHVEESMNGLVPKLFKKSLTAKLDSGLDNWLEYLKTECER